MESKRKELQNQVDCLYELRRETGMTRKAFSEYMDIPLRNLEEWEAGRRKMPDYLLRLLAYYIRTENVMAQKEVVMEDGHNEE